LVFSANLVSGAKLAHAAVHGGDYKIQPAPGTAQGALLQQELIYANFRQVLKIRDNSRKFVAHLRY
jgi:hypothetical protein